MTPEEKFNAAEKELGKVSLALTKALDDEEYAFQKLESWLRNPVDAAAGKVNFLRKDETLDSVQEAYSKAAASARFAMERASQAHQEVQRLAKEHVFHMLANPPATQ